MTASPTACVADPRQSGVRAPPRAAGTAALPPPEQSWQERSRTPCRGRILYLGRKTEFCFPLSGRTTCFGLVPISEVNFFPPSCSFNAPRGPLTALRQVSLSYLRCHSPFAIFLAQSSAPTLGRVGRGGSLVAGVGSVLSHPPQDSPAKPVEWSCLRGHKTGARPPLRQGEVKRSAWPLLALCLPFRVAMGQLATVSRKVHVPVGCTPAHHPHWLCGSGDRAAIGSQSGPGLSGREQMGFLPPHTLASSPGDCHQSLATPAASLESGGRRVHGRPAVSACE